MKRHYKNFNSFPRSEWIQWRNNNMTKKEATNHSFCHGWTSEQCRYNENWHTVMLNKVKTRSWDHSRPSAQLMPWTRRRMTGCQQTNQRTQSNSWPYIMWGFSQGFGNILWNSDNNQYCNLDVLLPNQKSEKYLKL